jgi:hypothetical protein
VKKVVSARGHRLIVMFDRAAVLAVLPNGNQVQVTVTGLLGGMAFRGVDEIRVNQ